MRTTYFLKIPGVLPSSSLDSCLVSREAIYGLDCPTICEIAFRIVPCDCDCSSRSAAMALARSDVVLAYSLIAFITACAYSNMTEI